MAGAHSSRTLKNKTNFSLLSKYILNGWFIKNKEIYYKKF